MDSDQLKEILASHKRWIQTGGNQGKRAELYRANLEGADLHGAYLYRASLDGANLQEANLEGANLLGAYLYRANLLGAYLHGADLQGAYLQEADLREAKFTIEIREVFSFEKAQVSEMQLPWLVLHPRFGEWMKSLKINP